MFPITNINSQIIKLENANADDEAVLQFVGEYVLSRDYESLMEVLPDKAEYERIRIHLRNNEVTVIYNGVEIVGDHGYVGLFVVEAIDVIVNRNKVSFTIAERSLYRPKNAPQDPEKEKEQRKVDTNRGINRNQILMNGVLTETGIEFQCESRDCYSNVMIFNRK